MRRNKNQMWKRTAAAALTGVMLLQAAGCAGTNIASADADTAQTEENAAGAGSDSVTEPEGNGLLSEYEDSDLDDSWQEEDSIVIFGSGKTAQVEGSGTGQAEVAEGRITITKAGTYIFRGEFDGQICVDADKDAVVRLVMDGFRISCADSAAVYGKQSEKIVIILAEGTENQVSDGLEYVYESAEEDEPDAAVFSKDDLVINGSGKLVVTGNYADGIRSKDDLKIVSGEILVTAAEDGIQGKDSVLIRSGSIQVTSGEDGIKSNHDSDPEKGYVIIDGGTIRVHAGDDGIHAETWLTIHGGEIAIEESYEGLEGMKVDINGGVISVKSSDDGINGAGASENSGETPSERPAGGNRPEREPGTDAPEEKQGMRGGAGAGGFERGGGSGGRGAMEADPDVYVRITGGQITVDSGADGIDSNGNVSVSGGTTWINGPVSGGDGALDYNGTAVISGGIFAAAGSARMMQTFSGSSSQPAIQVHYGEWKEAGTEISLSLAEQDGESSGQAELDTVLFSWTPKKEYECVLISIPELEEGRTYMLLTGEESRTGTISALSEKK